MRTKKLTWAVIAIAGALCCAANSPVYAEGGGAGGHAGHQKKGGPDAEAMLKNFTHHLQLSQAQQDKIRPILTAMVADLNAVWSDKTLTQQERADKAKATRSAAFDLVAAELTPEQKAKFDEYRAQKESGKHHEKPKKEEPKY